MMLFVIDCYGDFIYNAADYKGSQGPAFKGTAIMSNRFATIVYQKIGICIQKIHFL